MTKVQFFVASTITLLLCGLLRTASAQAATTSSPRTLPPFSTELCAGLAAWGGSFSLSECLPQLDVAPEQPPAILRNKPEGDSENQPPLERSQRSQSADFNRDIYYVDKLEFSFDGGWLPINIPFPFDVFTGDLYNLYPLHYTLVPILASLRWQVDDVAGPGILRGNWDITFSGAATVIPRGPETRYLAYIMGFRRNFVPPNSRIAAYWDARLGLGDINAKGPDGVMYAQGQDFTFTLNMGSGVRYNFNPRYAISAGLNWMHISNANLSQGNGRPNWGIRNYGINVLGPMFGIDVQLPRHHRHAE